MARVQIDRRTVEHRTVLCIGQGLVVMRLRGMQVSTRVTQENTRHNLE